MISALWRRGQSSGSRLACFFLPKPRHHRHRCFLNVEQLEDRRVPTVPVFVVNTVSDNISEFDHFTGQDGDGNVSLRSAIEAANNNESPAVIQFSIGEEGSVQTIQLNSALPPIFAEIFIDGWSQGGSDYQGTPLIEISGANFGGPNPGGQEGFGASGLVIFGDFSTVRGLVINDFPGNGIDVFASNVWIHGNYIGTDASGSLAKPNTIGISIFTGQGTRLDDAVGIPPEVSNVLIGSSSGNVAEANIISGNRDAGIFIGSSGNTVMGNYIGLGVGPTGQINQLLGNDGPGILIVGSNNTIGSTNPGAGNFIADNGSMSLATGVHVIEGTGNTIRGNSIFNNEGLGIQLDGFNEPGANNLQNAPQISAAEYDGLQLTVTFVVPSFIEDSAYPLLIDFYLADSDGQEGKTYLGTVSYLEGEARSQKTVSFPARIALQEGNRLLATATDGNRNTSEFSDSVLVAIEIPAGPSAIRPGFDTNTFPANDDESIGPISLGFSEPIDFFGQLHTELFINNNGNITFGGPLAQFTPFDLTATEAQIIAPFFSDVDTRFHGQVVTYGTGTVDGRAAFAVNWINIDYFFSDPEHGTQLNSFQIILIERFDTGPGNFDIEFNYGRIRWETGDASGGSGGLGGSSARAGYSNGSGEDGTFFELPGSGVNGAFLDSNTETGLIHHSLNSNTAGRYVFSARAGVIDDPGEPEEPEEPEEPGPQPENRAPAVATPAEIFVGVGTSQLGTGFASDPDGDALTITVNFGDGSPLVNVPQNADGTFALVHAYSEEGTYTLTVSVSDGRGGTAQSFSTVYVLPADPLLVTTATTVNGVATATIPGFISATLTQIPPRADASILLVAVLPNVVATDDITLNSVPMETIATFDVRIVNGRVTDRITVTFLVDSPSGIPPIMTWIDPVTGETRSVTGSGLVDPGFSVRRIPGTNTFEFVIILDGSSSPRIDQLFATVFTFSAPRGPAITTTPNVQALFNQANGQVEVAGLSPGQASGIPATDFAGGVQLQGAVASSTTANLSNGGGGGSDGSDGEVMTTEGDDETDALLQWSLDIHRGAWSTPQQTPNPNEQEEQEEPEADQESSWLDALNWVFTQIFAEHAPTEPLASSVRDWSLQAIIQMWLSTPPLQQTPTGSALSDSTLEDAAAPFGPACGILLPGMPYLLHGRHTARDGAKGRRSGLRGQ